MLRSTEMVQSKTAPYLAKWSLRTCSVVSREIPPTNSFALSESIFKFILLYTKGPKSPIPITNPKTPISFPRSYSSYYSLPTSQTLNSSAPHIPIHYIDLLFLGPLKPIGPFPPFSYMLFVRSGLPIPTYWPKLYQSK